LLDQLGREDPTVGAESDDDGGEPSEETPANDGEGGDNDGSG